jgi:hypothetical protein
MSGGGGTAAARGFRYQYLRTLDELITLVERDAADETIVHIECQSDPNAQLDSDVVDYAVSAPDGERLKVVQVKSVAYLSSAPMTAPAVFRVLRRLVSTGRSGAYELQTNSRLTAEAATLAGLLIDAPTDADLARGACDLLAGTSESAAASGLSEEAWRWLRHARVVRDERSAVVLRDELRERLRWRRVRSAAGVGTDASGVLTSYLIDEIFERAGTAGGAALDVKSFRSLLMTDSLALAQAIGERWGTGIGKVPWLPEIHRGDIQQRVIDALEPHRPPDSICRAAIHGASGLGKTSVAAAYAFEFSDAYDFVFWIEAENEGAIRTAFAEVLTSTERRVSGVGAGLLKGASLRERVHDRLARFPGTWLMVFDGALDQRMITPWVPATGRGHVLITSTNSASWTQYRRIEAKPMSRPQAVDLLMLRLNAPDEHDPRLAVLADELERWPLALELGAGYLVSCGLSVDAIPRYVRQLRRKALDDELSVPASYAANRTLVAALTLCVERLAASDSRAAKVALEMLRVSSYLAARRIPADLSLMCAVVPPEQARATRGPAELDLPDLPLEALVRALLSESLVMPDRMVQDHEQRGFRMTYSMYELVQVVMRTASERDPHRARTYVNGAAFHVQDWLSWCADEHRFDAVEAIQPHAVALVAHAERLAMRSLALALLLGNLAAAYASAGFDADAADLLSRELEHLASIGVPPSLIELKTPVALADALNKSGGAAMDIADQLDRCLRCLDILKLEDSELALYLTNVHAITNHVLAWAPEESSLRALMGEIDTRRHRIGPVPDDGRGIDAMDELNRLDLIVADDPLGAIGSTHELLERVELPVHFRLKAQALIVEAFAWTGNWTEAAQAQTIVAPMMITHRAAAGNMLSYLGNGCSAALATAIDAARSLHPSPSGLEALRYLRLGLDALAPLLEREPAPAYDRARYLAMKAGLAMASGDVGEAQAALDRVNVADLQCGAVRQINVYGPLLHEVQSWIAKCRR